MGKTGQKAAQLTGIVHRERLLKRLRSVAAPGIVVVSAQAAQGKSTLIADHLAIAGARTCWLDLHPEDAEPQQFYSHLQDACRAHWLPESAGPAAKDQSGRIAGRSIPGRMRDLLRRLPPDLHLVLDGWHYPAATPGNIACIEALTAACPARGGLYLISREEVPIKLQPKRMRHQALLLTGEELAFTLEEVKAFFASSAGPSADGDHWRYIHGLTAGWAGGLVLLAEALHRQQGDPQNIPGSPVLINRLHTEAGDFFQEEVFGRQSMMMQRFLAIAALLDTVGADLMRDQLGRDDADRLYAEAGRRNLFLQILDADPSRWRFRFNPLFRAFLLGKGREILPRKTIAAFLKKAALLCESEGDRPSAVQYFLDAGDTHTAAIGITKIGLQLASAGRFGEIEGWMAKLPSSSRQGDPWLALLKSLTYRIKGGQRTIRELLDVKQAFERAGHLRERMLALAYLIETAVFIGHDPVLRAQWIAEGDALLKEASRRPHFTYAKALLWQQVGFGLIAETTGDLRKGLSACQNAILLGKGIDAVHLVANALTIAAHGHVQAGEFDQARESLKAADALDDPGVFPEYNAFRDLTRIHLEMIGGRFEPASRLLKRLAADIDACGLIILYPAFLEASGLLEIYRQEYPALEKTRRHLRDTAILLNNPLYSARASWLAALGAYQQGRFQGALALLDTVMEHPALPTSDRARVQELMGFVALNLGDFNSAATHFEEALAAYDDAGMTLAGCETRIGMALNHKAREEGLAARQALDSAFRTIASGGFDHFPMIRPEDLSRACVLGLQLEIPSAAAPARHLLTNRLPETRGPVLTPPPPGAPLGQGGETDDTRTALYRARIPVLSISTFGGLAVLRSGTAPIAADNWQGSRPALLLKAILVHGGRHIPKDVLVEALWPDQPPEKSLRNFKVTLHRLRKLFEPEMTAALGSAYIHLKDNLVSLDTQLCRVDTVAFHHLCKQVRRTDPGTDRQTLQEMRREAEALYRGDFLPEEPYLPWAEMKRANLREEFLHLMYRLGELFFHQKAFGEARRCYRRIVQVDPAQEKAQRRLMRLLVDDGRPGEAARLYLDFKTHLEAEIGAAPDETTTRLYDSICARLKRKSPPRNPAA